MKNLLSWICGVLCFGLLSLGIGSATQAQTEPVDFYQTIQPLFNKYCVSCHGPEDVQAFRIDIKDDTMDYITAGDAEDSQLYQVLVTDDENELMPPPDEENPMSTKEIELVKSWINQGAKWPTKAPQTESPQMLPPVSDVIPVVPDDEKTTRDEPDTSTTPIPAPVPEKKITAGDQRIYRAIGSLHPATIHLPIGLLLAAGIFAFFSLRGNFVMSDCAYYCLWLGALGCVFACLTGWFAAPMKFRTEGVQEIGDLLNSDHRVFWHRTGGLVVAVLSIVLAMFAAAARNRDPDDGLLWKLCLILLAVAVGWVGHEGGKLTWGKYHYKDLNELAGEWFPSLFGPDKNVAPQPVDGNENLDMAPVEEEPAESDEVGSVSVET